MMGQFQVRTKLQKYLALFTIPATCPALHVLFDFIILMIFGEK